MRAFCACCNVFKKLRFLLNITDDLRQQVSSLTADYNKKRVPRALQEQVVFAYSKKILSEIDNLLSSPPSGSIEDALSTYLAANWSVIKGSCLSYTVLPMHDITQLLTRLACLLAAESSVEPKNALPILMPGLCFESYHNDFTDLTVSDEIAVTQVLSTHILSDSQKMLIPVRVLCLLDNDAKQGALPAPYYDYTQEDGGDGGFVSSSEYHRLSQHSQSTEAIIHTHAQYDGIVDRDKNSLLSQLSILCRHLAFNAVGNRGTEEHAAHGAYPAIINFAVYYEKFNEELKAKIPPELKKEIELLLNSSGNNKMRDAEGSVVTCIAFRRERLSQQISGKEVLLSSIKIGGEATANDISKALLQFALAKDSLASAIKKLSYQGQDQLPITTDILSRFQIKFTPFFDLDGLTMLSEDEILAILEVPDIKSAIIQDLSSADLYDLIFFAQNNVHPWQLKLFFSGLREPLLKKLNPSHLGELLSNLGPQKISAVLEGLGLRGLTRLISSSDQQVIPISLMLHLFNNENLSAQEQREIYGDEGPYAYYLKLRGNNKSAERIAIKSKLHWYLALLEEEGARLTRHEKTKVLGKKARELCEKLKQPEADITSLLAMARKELQRPSLQKIIDFIVDCFVALAIIFLPKNVIEANQLRFFPDRIENVVDKLSKEQKFLASSLNGAEVRP